MIRLRFLSFPALKSFCTSFALILACAVLSAPSVLAQDNPDEKVTISTSLVQLNVGVVDRQGKAVMNLSRNDFKVYEDGVLQPIADFEPAATPFSLVLLLDLSGSTVTFRPQLKQAAYRFLDALAPDDRVSVIVFNEKVKTVEGFTTDHKKIAKSIEYAEGRGETRFYDALKYSLAQLAKEGKRRKAIVVLTDGIDSEMRKLDREQAASAHTNDEAIAMVKPNASGPLNEVLRAADREGVTIFPLALPSGDPTRLPYLDPVVTAIYSAARSRLQSLADRTGGRLSEIRHLEDLGWLYAQVAASLRTLYTIYYRPTNTNAPPGSWHPVKVEVTNPELVASTKTGYTR